jgi:hypothetical protein
LLGTEAACSSHGEAKHPGPRRIRRYRVTWRKTARPDNGERGVPSEMLIREKMSAS